MTQSFNLPRCKTRSMWFVLFLSAVGDVLPAFTWHILSTRGGAGFNKRSDQSRKSVDASCGRIGGKTKIARKERHCDKSSRSTGIEYHGEGFSHTRSAPIGTSYSGRNPVRTTNRDASRCDDRWPKKLPIVIVVVVVATIISSLPSCALTSYVSLSSPKSFPSFFLPSFFSAKLLDDYSR